MENENPTLKYCLFYRGERDCPYNGDYEGRVWMAEMFGSERANETPRRFLEFVCAHLGKWAPFDCSTYLAKYIGAFPHCSMNEKMMVASIYGVGDALTFKKPKGSL